MEDMSMNLIENLTKMYGDQPSKYLHTLLGTSSTQAGLSNHCLSLTGKNIRPICYFWDGSLELQSSLNCGVDGLDVTDHYEAMLAHYHPHAYDWLEELSKFVDRR
jgi:hypothetical protein